MKKIYRIFNTGTYKMVKTKKLLLIIFFIILYKASIYSQEIITIQDSLSNNAFGPSSVTSQLIEENNRKPISALNNFFEFKNDLYNKSGFSFGVDYFTGFQSSTQSLGENISFSGVLRAYGSLHLIGKDTPNTGTFIFKFENRHSYGNLITGQALASEIGYVGLTQVTFSDAGWLLTNFYWQQELLNNRLAFIVGIVDATDYTNVYSMVDPWNDFSNLTFSTGVTIPAPNQGFGIALKGMLTQNFYALASITDANGNPEDPLNTFDSFFSTSEFFKSLELGWVKSRDSRFSDNIHLTYWHVSERQNNNIPEGWGIAFSFSRIYNDKWQPFVRGGYSNDGGAFMESSIEMGLGYRFKKNNNLIGIGIGTGKPSEATFLQDLDHQTTIETFYHWNISKVFTIVPDIQLLINPALNPIKNFTSVFGFKGKIVL